MKKSIVIALALFMLVIPLTNAQGPTGPEFHVRGSQVKYIGGYGDNMVYDGSNVQAGDGFVEMHLNAGTDTGSIVAQFTVPEWRPSAGLTLENPTITMIFPLFGSPTGVMPEYWEGGITDDTHLHGDSGNEAPIMPVVNNAVASWGPAMIFVNGEQLGGADTIMGAPNPMGAFAGHMMLTDRVRDIETEAVYNADKSGFYSPMAPSDGSVVDDEISLIHLIVRSEVPDENNFPGFDFFMHVNFEVVEETAPMPISQLNFEAMMSMEQDQVMAMIMGMMPGAAPAELPQSGGVRYDLSLAPYGLALGGVALLGLGLILRRRRKHVEQ